MLLLLLLLLSLLLPSLLLKLVDQSLERQNPSIWSLVFSSSFFLPPPFSSGHQHGPFGGAGGIRFDARPPRADCFLAYISGRAFLRLDAISFHWRCPRRDGGRRTGDGDILRFGKYTGISKQKKGFFPCHAFT